jgi:hypothetical protein
MTTILATIVFTQGSVASSQVSNNSPPPIEEEARRLVWAEVSKNGVPRKVSQEYNLVKVEAIGKRFVKTYEFAYPISQASDHDRLALSQEAKLNFKANVCPSAMRPLLKRGLIVVQKINYFNSGNIVSTEFGEADCR